MDVDDQCPNEPETYNGLYDEDGCPDRSAGVIMGANRKILRKVYFSHRDSRVLAMSRQVLTVLMAMPRLQGRLVFLFLPPGPV